MKELSENDACRLWKEIPNFEDIPAYVSGFLDKGNLSDPIHMLKPRVKTGKRPQLVIERAVGLLSRENVLNHPDVRALDKADGLPIVVDPIGDLTNTHFLANSGALDWGEEKWKALLERM